MREVALVQTTYRTLAREEELAVEDGSVGDDDRRLVLVIVVVDDRRSSGPRGRVYRRPVFRSGPLATSEARVVPRDRPTGRGICSRCYGGAYLAPIDVP